MSWARRVAVVLARIAVGAAVAFGVDLAAGAALRRAGSLPDPSRARPVARSARRILERPFAQPSWVATDRPHRDRVVVALLGGSFADDLGIDLERTRGAAWRAAVEGRAPGRRAEVLNLAIPGGAQPIQANLLGVSWHRVDEAVFVDGFNELTRQGAACDGTEAFWRARGARPSGDLLGPALARMRRFLRWAEGEQTWLERRSATVQLLRVRANLARTRDVQGDLRDIDGDHPMTAEGAAELPAAGLAARWAACVRATDRLARAWGVRARFFVQPNQYASTDKPLTAEERACCVRPGPVNSGVAERYDALDAEVARLRAEGVAVWSLRGVFAGVRETVWRDDCCHVNARGVALVEAAIARRLAE